MIQHKHLLVRIEGNSHSGDDANGELKKFIEDMIKAIRMDICLPFRSEFVDQKGNEGITWNVGLVTSHAAGHEWIHPNRDLMHTKAKHLIQFDLYTCGELNESDVEHILYHLAVYYDSLHIDYRTLDRSRGFYALD